MHTCIHMYMYMLNIGTLAQGAAFDFITCITCKIAFINPKLSTSYYKLKAIVVNHLLLIIRSAVYKQKEEK